MRLSGADFAAAGGLVVLLVGAVLLYPPPSTAKKAARASDRVAGRVLSSENSDARADPLLSVGRQYWRKA